MNESYRKRILQWVALYFKWWHLFWLLLSLISLIVGTYLSISDDYFKSKRIFFVHGILIFKSLFYYKLAALFISYNGKIKDVTHVNRYFVLLFIINILELLFGQKGDLNKKTTISILEALPQDSFVYEIFSKVYLYIPAIFEFITPEFSGVSIVVFAAIVNKFILERDALGSEASLSKI